MKFSEDLILINVVFLCNDHRAMVWHWLLAMNFYLSIRIRIQVEDKATTNW